MDRNRCPICGQPYSNEHDWWSQIVGDLHCLEQDLIDEEYAYYYCAHYDVEMALHRDIIDVDFEDELREEILNLITEYVLHLKANNKNLAIKRRNFYFNESKLEDDELGGDSQYVNVARLMQNYPRKAIDVANRSLINLSIKYSQYGEIISPKWIERRLFFEHKGNNNGINGVLGILVDLGYVKEPEQKECYVITVEGWQKIEELQKENQIVKQGFVAMSFDEKTENIRETFRKAIRAAGYDMRIIDEKEHNNQIVPEIFFEIQRSNFVVVDVTYPNYGAYYEAGYAQALGKQVIICCQKDMFNDENSRPHFDISQKSLIVWEDENDLIDRLKRRIEATVGGL